MNKLLVSCLFLIGFTSISSVYALSPMSGKVANDWTGYRCDPKRAVLLDQPFVAEVSKRNEYSINVNVLEDRPSISLFLVVESSEKLGRPVPVFRSLSPSVNKGPTTDSKFHIFKLWAALDADLIIDRISSTMANQDLNFSFISMDICGNWIAQKMSNSFSLSNTGSMELNAPVVNIPRFYCNEYHTPHNGEVQDDSSLKSFRMFVTTMDDQTFETLPYFFYQTVTSTKAATDITIPLQSWQNGFLRFPLISNRPGSQYSNLVKKFKIIAEDVHGNVQMAERFCEDRI